MTQSLPIYIQKIYDFFLGNDFIGIENYDEHLKARFLLKLCLCFLLFSVLFSPIVLHISPIAFLLLGGVLLVSILTLFLLKWKKNTTTSATIFLLTAFIYVAHLHLLTGQLEGLAIFLWYVVIILSASFMLNKRWAQFYVFSSLAMIFFIALAKHIDLIIYPVNKFEGVDRLWSIPIRIGIPLYFIYLIAKQFVLFKEKATATTQALLDYQKDLNVTLASKKEYYHAILEEVGDIIYEINLVGKFSYINNAGVELTGYERSEIYKMTFDACIVEEDKIKHRKLILEQLQLGKRKNYSSFRIRTKNGAIIWIGQTTKFNYDAAGNYVNSFCVARNITKSLEEREILKAAKDEAIKHNRAKDSFMATISHELRTPLNSVIALGYNLLDNEPRVDQKEDISTMLYSSNILLNLINNILDFSLIEKGQFPIKKDNFNVKELLEQIVNSHLLQLDNDQLFIDLKIDKSIPIQLIGDASRLSQVLNNLLQNAIKFTPKGLVVLTLKLDRIKDNKVKIYFEVKDTGIGIEQSQQSIIFDRFTQLDNTLSRNYGGAGIGLSIVKMILMRLNSQIHVNSEIDKGTTFSFNLTFDQQLYPIRDTPKTAKIGLIGASVLLVEDNKINQLVAKKLLHKWKAKVDVADNGKIALNKAKACTYDIILMDIEMPVMNGLEATKKIRAFCGLDLPIIAVSATTSKEILNNFTEYQFTDIVSKPYRPALLYQKMVLHYSKIKSRQALQPISE